LPIARWRDAAAGAGGKSPDWGSTVAAAADGREGTIEGTTEEGAAETTSERGRASRATAAGRIPTAEACDAAQPAARVVAAVSRPKDDV
jgi:hypothetical protein